MESDQQARDMAQTAQSRIEAHEDVCAVRWANAAQAMTDVKYELRLFARQMWAANGMVMVTMLGLIGWLATRAFH